MSHDPKTRCVAVRSPRGAHETVLEWGDGHVGRYPHAILRGYCPCASCQGHSGTIAFVESEKAQQEIDDIEPVGNYALRIQWFDGHGSGLYSFKYLRALCHCSSCRPEGTAGPHGELPRL